MGTRSLTVVKDETGKEIIIMYRQFDGYISGHGAELYEFLKDMAIVNGVGKDTPEKAANGMGCLAAQLVAHFKTGIGGFYLWTPTPPPYDDWQEYTYTIYMKDDELRMTANSEYRGDLWDGAVTSENEKEFSVCDDTDEDEEDDVNIEEEIKEEEVLAQIHDELLNSVREFTHSIPIMTAEEVVATFERVKGRKMNPNDIPQLAELYQYVGIQYNDVDAFWSDWYGKEEEQADGFK